MNEIKILYADHGTDLKSYLSNLNSGDINLMAGSHLFQFHRQYLAAVSPLVRHLLQSQPFSDTITLDGVSPDILQCLVHILYYGETQVNPGQLNHLTSLINDLEMTFDFISDKPDEIIPNEVSCDVEELVYVEDFEEETNKVEWIEDGVQIEDLNLVPISDEALLVESSSSPRNNPHLEYLPKFAENVPHNKKKQKRFKSLPTPSNPVSCEQCDQIFTSYTGLTSHMLSHKNEKPFECEECGARFRQVSQLKVHKRIHSNEKAFTCEVCGKSFRHHDSLKEHHNLHTGETPFACTVCGKAFRQKKMLRIHNCNYIWPQNCVKCGEELQSARDLTAHKIHCREVFACKYCVLTCSSETELKEHIAIHKAETRQCNYCDAYFDDLADLNDHLTMHTNSVF
ncbi:zinc finger protein 675-like [Artemia franciscana]|uniref:zinc finger protein 675-like n=1 Tax=Artemia franciscana TaxID=6661 RepID=UPI0032DA606B